MDARQDTRERLLDAVEALFLDHGYDGTSSRMITAAADANLAAVNYHFGGKEGLFQAMLARRLDGLHADRLAQLERDEAQARGRALSCERILAALFMPALAQARDPRRGGRDFLRLLGRAYVDPAPALRAFLSERYAPTLARFKRQELTWRLHFTMGALAYTLAGADAWKLIAAIAPATNGERAHDDERLLRRLAPFLIAGLQAPLPDLDAVASAPASVTPLAARAARKGSPASRAPGARLQRGAAS
jgi:AcrR family transcriptional regulator